MRITICLALALLLLAAPHSSTAQTNWSGASGNNWSVPANWSNGLPAAGVTTVINSASAVQLTDPAQATGTITIGNSGTGSLAISSNGALTSSNAFLGSPTASTGTATVTGASASWNVTNTLAIGGNATTAGGSGSLNVSGGATISVGGTLKQWGGTLTLNGGSITTQSYNRSGGTFNFQDGTFTVSGGTFTEPTAATRFLTIQGNASDKTPTLVLDALQNAPDYNGGIYIADAANRNGALTLSGGTVVTAQGLLVGRNSGSIGQLVLDGAGTSLTNGNGNGSDIGRTGAGTLEIRNGATLTETASAYIGVDAGSSGTATISGAGSSWNNTGIFRIGSRGTGVLNVLAGGQVTSTEGRIGELAGSTGTVTVSGAGSTWTNSGAIFVGGTGTASGTLNITNGGTVNIGSATIAGFIGASSTTPTGAVTVDGIGSTWTSSDLITIGNNGSGTLTIQNGGMVSNTRAYLGYNSDSVGTATVTGAGSTWTNSEAVYIGNSGRGIVDVLNGADATSVNLTLGNNSTHAVSRLTVDGVGSTWGNTGTLFVGRGAGSTLDITNGGQVTTNTTYVAYQAAYNYSTLNIDGAGSKLSVNGDLYNAWGYTGLINVTNGGALVVTNWLVLFNPGNMQASAGIVTLDGGTITTKNFDGTAAGGSLTHNDGTLTVDGGTFNYRLNDLFVVEGGSSTKTASIVLNDLDHSPSFLEIDVGYNTDQRGALTISGGTQVSTNGVYLGRATGSNGDLLVTGTGSKLTAQQVIGIGGSSFESSGTGRLTIADGGTVTAQAGAIIWEDGTLEGNGGTFEGNITNHGIIAPGSSPGTFTIDGNLTLTATGSIQLEIQSPTAGTGYDQLFVTGTFDINAGSLSFNFNSYAGDPLGQVFTIFPGQDFSGQTFGVNWTGLDPGYGVDTTTYANIGAISVIAVPEPGTGLLLGFGLFLFVRNRRRR